MNVLARIVVTALVLASPELVAEPRIETVRPSETDSAITRFDRPHRIFLDADAAPRAQLLVFLPGTGARTSGQDDFGRTAAALGYHVLYLMYPNDTSSVVCRDDDDRDSFEKFRREILSGEDLSSRVDVDRPNGIEHRLLRLVQWLAREHPDEGWGRFLAGDAIEWSRLVLAGHSQGGGHALLLAKDHRVARVVVMGAPKDYSRRHEAPAAWYGIGATPADRMFALVHEQDKLVIDFAQQLANLRASGLTTRADIDATEPPYQHARILVTNQPGTPVNSVRAHLSLVIDFTLPRKEGRNLLRPAWVYMLTEPVP